MKDMEMITAYMWKTLPNINKNVILWNTTMKAGFKNMCNTLAR